MTVMFCRGTVCCCLDSIWDMAERMLDSVTLGLLVIADFQFFSGQHRIQMYSILFVAQSKWKSWPESSSHSAWTHIPQQLHSIFIWRPVWHLKHKGQNFSCEILQNERLRYANGIRKIDWVAHFNTGTGEALPFVSPFPFTGWMCWS